jgi:hypothetical protein
MLDSWIWNNVEFWMIALAVKWIMVLIGVFWVHRQLVRLERIDNLLTYYVSGELSDLKREVGTISNKPRLRCYMEPDN